MMTWNVALACTIVLFGSAVTIGSVWGVLFLALLAFALLALERHLNRKKWIRLMNTDRNTPHE